MSSPAQALLDALHRLDQPFSVVRDPGGELRPVPGPLGAAPEAIAFAPALPPAALGDSTFLETYGVRAAYATGAMANGIASESVVIAMARAGMLGFFGAAGLPTARIASAIDRVQAAVGGLPTGWNLIHSPADPRQEQETVDLYLARGVRIVDAAAYLALTPQVVQYRATGVHRDPTGAIVAPNRLIAKISREETAERFLRPPPAALLERLAREGRITATEAALAARIPMADDLTCEADSGGHTDNRPLPVLLPTVALLARRTAASLGLTTATRVGAAGGIATPEAVAAAFQLGAAYVMTGTINQACVEAGTSDLVKRMLADASLVDVAMAPASDMFEAGVTVQVLQRGTLFPQRGRLLYALWRAHPSWEAIPAADRTKVESQILRAPFHEIWAKCEAYFRDRDPSQLDRAAREPKHQLALVFRWYLGMASRWAIDGEATRAQDLQVWCGPAIGAFNAWTRDTFLAEPAARQVDVVAANLMTGAAAVTRATFLRLQGVDLGPTAFTWVPRPLRSAL
jgi:trans-AT polyketide synthase/acyltransferase/oxidoreductase domain-containing protein